MVNALNLWTGLKKLLLVKSFNLTVKLKQWLIDRRRLLKAKVCNSKKGTDLVDLTWSAFCAQTKPGCPSWTPCNELNYQAIIDNQLLNFLKFFDVNDEDCRDKDSKVKLETPLNWMIKHRINRGWVHYTTYSHRKASAAKEVDLAHYLTRSVPPRSNRNQPVPFLREKLGNRMKPVKRLHWIWCRHF